MTISLPLSAIKIGDRVRKEYNNIEELAASINEQGLIHPPTIDSNNNLIAGGRRMQALILIEENRKKEFNKSNQGEYFIAERFEFNIMDGEVTPRRLRRLEIEENSQREDITWLEKCLGIAEYHRDSEHEARLNGDTWSQKATGELLGMEQSSVSWATRLASLYKKDPKNKIFESETMDEAVRLMTVAKLDETTKLRLERQRATRTALEKSNASLAVKGSTMELVAGLKREAGQGTQPPGDQTTQSTSGQTKPKKKELVSYDDVVNFYHIGNCLELLPKIAAATKIHHIICDPPYAIDMEGILRMKKVDRVEDEHEVEPNLQLLKQFIITAYDCIDEAGFLCLWYAPEHYQFIVEAAEWVGWTVCRWPFVWCKSSGGVNRAAQYNITKSTEFCLFLRRSPSSIIATKQSKNYLECPSITSTTHPFVKPFLVWEYIIRTVSQEGQNILDPFAGEGSCLSAVFKLGRNPIGIELVEGHAANGMSYLHEELNRADIIPAGGSPWAL